MQGVYLATLNAAVHVAPRAHLFRAFNVVVGHVHASSVSHLAINYHNLAVVAVKHVVYPWKAQWVKLVYLYAAGAQVGEVAFQQGLIVRVVAKPIEEGTHLNPLLCFFGQNVEQQRGDRVVAEIKVFEMYAAFSLTNGMKHIVKLFLPTHEQGYCIIV